jgi:hypothetical protein
MRLLICRLVIAFAVAFASMGFVTVATPAVSSACAYGEWWDPVAGVCRPSGLQLPKNCGNGWWDPVINNCRPPLVPLACFNGAWWDPVANVCRPPLV